MRELSHSERKRSSSYDIIGSPRKSFDISNTSITQTVQTGNQGHRTQRNLFSSTNSAPMAPNRTSSGVRKDLYASWVESKPWGIFITIVTLYALFGDDFRLLAFSKKSDETFYLLSFFAFLIFALEIVVSVYARKNICGASYFGLI